MTVGGTVRPMRRREAAGATSKTRRWGIRRDAQSQAKGRRRRLREGPAARFWGRDAPALRRRDSCAAIVAIARESARDIASSVIRTYYQRGLRAPAIGKEGARR